MPDEHPSEWQRAAAEKVRRRAAPRPDPVIDYAADDDPVAPAPGDPERWREKINAAKVVHMLPNRARRSGEDAGPLVLPCCGVPMPIDHLVAALWEDVTCPGQTRPDPAPIRVDPAGPDLAAALEAYMDWMQDPTHPAVLPELMAIVDEHRPSGEHECEPSPYVRDLESKVRAIAAENARLVNEADARGREPEPAGGLRGLLAHFGVDVDGKTITVAGKPIDDVGAPVDVAPVDPDWDRALALAATLWAGYPHAVTNDREREGFIASAAWFYANLREPPGAGDPGV